MSRLESLREALANARSASAVAVYEMEIIHLLAVAKLVARAHAAGLTLSVMAEWRDGPTSTPIPRYDCVTPGCTRAGGHVGTCGITYTFAKRERP